MDETFLFVFDFSGFGIEVTLGEGDAFHQAQELVGQGAEIIAVYGGDGTVSEVATAVAGTESALAILPGGTGNVQPSDTREIRYFNNAGVQDTITLGTAVVVEGLSPGEHGFHARYRCNLSNDAGYGRRSLTVIPLP